MSFRTFGLVRTLHARCSPLVSPGRCTARTFSSRRLAFHLGLSYASKDSPPFLTAAQANARPRIGFGDETRIGRWKTGMLALGGGRGELLGAETKQEEGPDGQQDLAGEKERLEMRRRWGAGEDFFLINQDGNSKTHLAVSDGVGGWSSTGHDPSLFSQALMYHADRAIRANPSLDPRAVMQKGYDGTMKEGGVPCGSATACTVSLDSSTGRLSAANLGDSGYSIIRGGKVIFAAPSQTHYFNCPRQLTKLENGMQGEGNIMDLPKASDVTSHSVQPGDMIVLYTDGMSDNLPDKSLLQLLQHVHATLDAPANSFLLPQERQAETAKLFADVLVGYSRLLMAREDVVSPFEIAAAREGLRYKGGKIDDITVITALVAEDSA